MTEEHVIFQSGSLAIEGVFQQNPETSKGVVVTHPHPLMGGNMDNPVVETIAAVYFRKGYSTLRFNFRGAGKSQGRFDDGVGEVDDLTSAVSFLQTRGVKTIEISGYSFGVWINILALSKGYDYAVTSMVSPPVDFISFPGRVDVKSLRCVICGDSDEYGSVPAVQAFADQCNRSAAVRVIPDTNHFYSGKLMQLGDALMELL